MKRLKLVCPRCGSKTARQWGRKDTKIFDEDHYEIMREEFINPDCENYFTAECICDDCENHFETKVIIDVQTLEIRY